MPDLATFFQKKKTELVQDQKRRAAVRQQWLDDLRGLRAELRKWLEPAEREGLLVEEYDHPVREQLLGAYDAPALRFGFGGVEARIVPVARYIVGGTGRVDVEFPGDRVLLVRQGRDNGWQIVRDDRPEGRPLTMDAFAQVVQEAFSQ